MRRAREPYDPFRYDTRPVHRIECPWHIVEDDDPRMALKTLARFRRSHPEHGRVPAEDLTWGYAWTEKPVLLDMSGTAEERAERRAEAVGCIVAFSSRDGVVTYSTDLLTPPQFVVDAILDEEIARKLGSDWMHHVDGGQPRRG